MILLPVIVALALAACCAAGSRVALRVAPLAGLGALALALLPARTLELPLVLVGIRFDVDEVSQPLLLLTGIAWSLAGWYAGTAVRTGLRRFWTWWSGTLAAVLVALLAADIAGFYAGYAATTLAAYGLIVHAGSDAARRAARIYLGMALVAEMLILYGLLSLAGGDDVGVHVAWLLFAGFAVKLGIVPLHVWLPLAHSIAPAPASAILSGVIVKVGLLGWLRFLSTHDTLGDIDPSAWLFALGIATSFYGALAGLGQRRLKTVLAYSTVSQMGLACVGFALVLGGQPVTAVALFALHHGLNKAALFVGAGIGVGRSRLRFALMVLPAAALAGLPLTSGFLAKGGLKHQLYDAGLAGWPLLAFTLTAFTTTLLMARALWLATRDDTVAPMHPAWPLLVAAGLLVPWLWALGTYTEVAILDAVWPVVAAAVVAAAWLRSGRGGPTVPEGDLLAWLARIPVPRSRPRSRVGTVDAPDGTRWSALAARAIRGAEDALLRLPGTGLVLLVVTGVLWWLMR